jgi:hypothetical protein
MGIKLTHASQEYHCDTLLPSLTQCTSSAALVIAHHCCSVCNDASHKKSDNFADHALRADTPTAASVFLVNMLNGSIHVIPLVQNILGHGQG